MPSLLKANSGQVRPRVVLPAARRDKKGVSRNAGRKNHRVGVIVSPGQAVLFRQPAYFSSSKCSTRRASAFQSGARETSFTPLTRARPPRRLNSVWIYAQSGLSWPNVRGWLKRERRIFLCFRDKALWSLYILIIERRGVNSSQRRCRVFALYGNNERLLKLFGR